ncbi:helix-turn-helix transcriptional regulator [Ralstonia sp. NFACC01]|jgi:DNA-binding CsgD family transcriptional regulator|uniref:helix-turn-helix transcriptional regulator n=1 Tax=unclassified Ralstonia TaxID=209769 RepID=UPI0008ECBEC6|nr:helix-turn-helix transcriptional regulator [Ralstonia sp. NFACC01]SFQ02344.1 regulatory protein, luxR family [Ralstonia sp. NFACC01]
MNARAQNDVLLHADDNTRESRYFSPLPVAAAWRAPAVLPVTITVRQVTRASNGVILVDLTELAEAAGEDPPAQPVTLEQAHAMLGRMLESTRKAPVPPSDRGAVLSVLTPRQCDILREAASGKSNVEIAQALHIGVETVKSHVRQILMRLQARNRTELAALYQQCVGDGRSRESH